MFCMYVRTCVYMYGTHLLRIGEGALYIQYVCAYCTCVRMYVGMGIGYHTYVHMFVFTYIRT